MIFDKIEVLHGIWHDRATAKAKYRHEWAWVWAWIWASVVTINDHEENGANDIDDMTDPDTRMKWATLLWAMRERYQLLFESPWLIQGGRQEPGRKLLRSLLLRYYRQQRLQSCTDLLSFECCLPVFPFLSVFLVMLWCASSQSHFWSTHLPSTHGSSTLCNGFRWVGCLASGFAVSCLICVFLDWSKHGFHRAWFHCLIVVMVVV